MTDKQNKALIEALLFASPRPIGIDVISEVTGMEPGDIGDIIRSLLEEYDSDNRGFSLLEVAGGYQLRTRSDFADEVGALFLARARRRFSRSSLETLSIIAYRQPVLRSEIEKIRGVDSGGVLKTLLSHGMIRVLGRKEAPGRPIMYGTTSEFLEYFSLRDLESLPTLQEVAELDTNDGIVDNDKDIENGHRDSGENNLYVEESGGDEGEERATGLLDDD